MMKMRWSLVLMFAVTLVACGDGGERQPVPLTEFGYVPNTTDSWVDIGVASCNGEPTFELTETDTEVRVAVVSWISSGDVDTCQDSIHIELEQPLGDRVLVDELTGQQVFPVVADEN